MMLIKIIIQLWKHLQAIIEIAMKNIIIIGANGLGKELAYHIGKINKIIDTYRIVGFVDDNPEIYGKEVIYGLKVIGTITDLLNDLIEVNTVFIAIANNQKRTHIYNQLKHKSIIFPNIIDPSVDFDVSNTIGVGNFIAHHCLLTCNITIGNFNILNGSIGLGHDVSIGNFNLFGPRSTIAGNVVIGNENTINMQSSIIQNLKIGNRNTINLHSCLFKSIKDDNVYFGVPAMRQKF